LNNKLKTPSGLKLHSPKSVRRSLTPKKEIPQSLFWIAGIVFGMAVAAVAQSNEASLEKNLDIPHDPLGQGDDKANQPQQFNLGPKTRILLAEIANEPISDAPKTAENLNKFFKNWFAENKTPQPKGKNSPGDMGSQKEYQDAITIAVEKAAIKYANGGLGSGSGLVMSDTSELYSSMAFDNQKMLIKDIPLQFSNEGKGGADITAELRKIDFKTIAGVKDDASWGSNLAYLPGGGLAGGGGGGGGGGAASAGASAGGGGSAVVAVNGLGGGGGLVDGYVTGATLRLQRFNTASSKWVDVTNSDGTSVTTVTDLNGAFSFNIIDQDLVNSLAGAQTRILAEAGGFDAFTGQQVGQFISEFSLSQTTADQTTFSTTQQSTPLTMLLKLSGMSEEQFKATIGIAGVPDLRTFDPIEEMLTGNGSLGETVFKVQQGLYTLQQALASMVAGGSEVEEAALSTAMNAISSIFSSNAANGGSLLTLEDITNSAVDSLLVGDITDANLKARATDFASSVKDALNTTINKILSEYSGLADALRDPTSSESQTLLTNARAAASLSQAELIAALKSASLNNYDTVTAYNDNFANLLASSASAFQELAASSGSVSSGGGANQVLNVSQALSYVGTDAQIKDLSSSFGQISLAKLLALNVNSVTLMGASSAVDIVLNGNGLTAYGTGSSSVSLANIQAGVFDSDYSVTLKVTDADLINVVRYSKELSAAGIDALKSVSGTLRLSAADAITLINEGISFATGTFQILPVNSIDYATAKTIVINGGLKLPPGTPIDTRGQEMSASEALKFINAGASFPFDPVVAIEASDLGGNSNSVISKLINLSSYGFKYVFSPEGSIAGSGVEFVDGTLTLSGISLTLVQAKTLVEAAVAGGLKFSNVTVSLAASDLADSGSWVNALLATGIKAYSLPAGSSVSVTQANQLLNQDSSLTLIAKLDASSAITATEASYYAGKGLTPPESVKFDLDYVKSFILEEGGKFSSTVTINEAFTTTTLSAADFSELVNAGVKFGKIDGSNIPVGKYQLTSSDSAFLSGNSAITNLFKLVNAGLHFSENSEGITNANLNLGTAAALKNAGIQFVSGNAGNNVLQLSSAELNSTTTLAIIQNLGITNIKTISGVINLTQLDSLASIVGLKFNNGTALQITDVDALIAAAAKSDSPGNYFGDKGINSALLTPTSLTYTQAIALKSEGILSLNSGLTLTLDNLSSAALNNLDAIAAMGVITLSTLPGAKLTKLEVDTILNENPSFKFIAGTPIDLTGTATSASEASLYSSKGLAFPSDFTIAANAMNLSDAFSIANRGGSFTAGANDKIQISIDSADATVSLIQAQKVISAAVGGGISFIGGVLKLSGFDLQSISSSEALSLSRAGLTTVKIVGTISAAQAKVLVGTSLAFESGTVVSDRNVELGDANNLIAKGVKFASGSTLKVSAADLVSIMNDSNGDPQILSLKVSGFSNLLMADSSAASLTKIDVDIANGLANIGGISISGAVINATSLTASNSAKYASLGITIPTGIALVVEGNTISFGEIFAIANKGGLVVPETGSRIIVSVAATDSLTYAKLKSILDASKLAGSDTVSLIGNTTLNLASGNTDLGEIAGIASRLGVTPAGGTVTSGAGITAIKSATGSINVSFLQQANLKDANIAFTASDNVTLQLSAANANISDVATAAAAGSLAKNIDQIKAAGAQLIVSQAQADQIISSAGLSFVSTDAVTLKLNTNNSNANFLTSDAVSLSRLNCL